MRHWSGQILTSLQPIRKQFWSFHLSCSPTVHHRGICSSFVPAGVQPPISTSQIQQRTHGAPQRQLRLRRKQRLPEEEEPPAAHHLLSAGPQLPNRQHPQQTRAHAEPVRRRAAGVRSQPQPRSSAAQHEHHSQLLGPQQQHQAGNRHFQPQVRWRTPT